MKKLNSNKKNNFSLKIDRERLLEFSKTSVVGRLKWLEEANKFIASIDNGRVRKNWLNSR